MSKKSMTDKPITDKPRPSNTSKAQSISEQVEEAREVINYSQSLVNAFYPVYALLCVVGQLPFEIYKQTETLYGLRFRKFGIRTVLFGITFIIYTSLFTLITFGLFCDYFELIWFQKSPYTLLLSPSFRTYEEPREVEWEDVMTENHKGVIYTTYALLFTALAGNVHILVNGRRHIHYFNYWNKVVEVTRIDPTTDIDIFYKVQFGLCCLQVFFDLVYFYFFNGVRAMAGVYACWILRLFVDEVPAQPWFFTAQVFVMIFLIFGHISTRALMVQFIFFCFLLKNMAKEWNVRLRRGMKTYLSRATTELRRNREDFRSLLRDHLIIIQLFKITDVTFAMILKFYYGTQICSIMIQLIHFWKLSGYIPLVAINDTDSAPLFPHNVDPEILDFKSKNEFTEGILTVSICLLTVAIFSIVAGSAQNATNEAMMGFNLVRRRGLMNCETKAERNFLYTLVVSYARHNSVSLTIDGYSTLNKEVTLAMLAVLAGHIIHFIQYEVEKYYLPKEAYRNQFPSPFF